MKSEPESVSYESRYSRLQYSSFVIFVGVFPLAFNSGTDVKDAQVICVSTGTKCITASIWATVAWRSTTVTLKSSLAALWSGISTCSWSTS